MTTSIGSKVLLSAVLCVAALAACDRVVTTEENPEQILPSGYHLLEQASFTPSGSGTEFRTAYWLVSPPSGVSVESAIDEIGARFETDEYTAIAPPADYWPSLSFERNDGDSIVDVGDHSDFQSSELDLHRQAMQDFADAAANNPEAEVVVTFTPTGRG